ncbi:alpha-E domain-containing protein [Flavobacterium gawalongense]|uniref:Alpha-E domain-containing protein n=1 Tax=Flavobacterium gawalongense TaxID=2594432 RepID=A0A553BWF3_9FLAO|nr:alpha-E domain-containing protein [Flavobacterium gawalongense]TRX01988.1 alpha-E domain-containing protein [Flavobacterium gawalongense]TRX06516.1 alpha-E domain-containing protein [Flavobacterium gawalongense]TRX09751.1 alpha-E domain-containing protein [Flavobacterium gawalongense]TRX12558.1 alpha-E domain-containing protein [Flavobacterium gawalongense]TRX26874.1 alpha-E domain-containing protein [Flavobacterium gawalongense]
MKVNMLSRVADGMFWLNRYMERTDGMLLTLNTFYILSFDKETNDSQGYKPLLEYYTDLPTEQINQVQYDTNFVLKYIICDSPNHNSVKNLVIKARENARGSQDKITKELWEHINSLYHFMNSPDLPKKLETSDASTIISKLNKDFLLYNGILQVTMPRGLGWCFSSIGKHIERCLQTISLTQAYYAPIQYNLDGNEDLLYWRRLLLSLSGYELYLKSYSNIPHNRKVVQQVIFNRDFAHSVIYTLELIDTYLNNLFKDNNLSEARTLHNQFGRLKSSVEFTDYHHLTNQELEDVLNNTRTQLIQFSTDFSKLFFSYT